MEENEKLWEKAVDFHGHACPGLAIGFRAALLALERLGVDRAEDEELVAVAETDACSVDAIQVVTGCSIGKGNLIFKNHGKQAFTIASRRTGKAVRVYLDGSKLNVPQGDRQAKIEAVLHHPAEEFCTVETIPFQFPEEARIFPSVICASCGEKLAESRARLQDGKIVCLACYRPYKRGW